VFEQKSSRTTQARDHDADAGGDVGLPIHEVVSSLLTMLRFVYPLEEEHGSIVNHLHRSLYVNYHRQGPVPLNQPKEIISHVGNDDQKNNDNDPLPKNDNGNYFDVNALNDELHRVSTTITATTTSLASSTKCVTYVPTTWSALSIATNSLMYPWWISRHRYRCEGGTLAQRLYHDQPIPLEKLIRKS
jgi:hypothetical protein